MSKIIRKTRPEDYADLIRIYHAARDFMAATGNPNQWGRTFPPDELVKEDIEKGVNYAVEEDGRIVGVFALFYQPDPTYAVIEEGTWLNDEPYGVIHRIASDGTVHGLLPAVVAFAAEKTENIRIDTAHANLVMQHLLDKNGFTKCGIIHLENGAPRIAYQKIIRK